MSSSLLLDDRLLLFLILDFFLLSSFLSLDLLLLLLLVIVISRDLLRLRDLLWLFETLLELDFFELLIRFLKSFGDLCRDFLRLSGLDALLDRVDSSLGDALVLGLLDDLSLLSFSPLFLPEA